MRSSPVETWHSALRRGLEHQRAGRFEAANACFEQAHRLAPERPEVCYALGRARLRTGAVDEAEALLRAAWQGDRTLMSAAGTLARCLGLHATRFEEAHAVLDEAEAHHGPAALLGVVRSELYLAVDRLDDARAAADDALHAPGSDSERNAARVALARVANQEGLLCAERGELERALFHFKQAAHLDPTWSSPHVNQGAALVRLGMFERAVLAYDLAIELEPDNSTAHENRGMLRRAQGDLPGARADLGRALMLDPHTHGAALALAAVCRELADPRGAATVLSEAIEHSPEAVELWYELGMAFAEADDRDNAEACWRQALHLEPSHPGACTSLASLLVRDGRLHEAAVLARRVADERASSGEPRRPGKPS